MGSSSGRSAMMPVEEACCAEDVQEQQKFSARASRENPDEEVRVTSKESRDQSRHTQV